MKVAVIQNDPTFGEKKKNIAQALKMMESASANVYVLPELFATGYNLKNIQETASLAEPFQGGETYEALKSFAIGHNCYVIYGFAEVDGATLYNSAGMIGYDGNEDVYRKIHLFDREKLHFTSGNLGFKVFHTPYGKIGIMICFDWYYPESARTLASLGAQLIVHPSNLVLPNCPNSMPTRSLENRVFTATANRIGTEDRGGFKLSYIGQSQITSTNGDILHRASSNKMEVIVEEIDLSKADDKHVTERNHLFNDRRPKYYV